MRKLLLVLAALGSVAILAVPSKAADYVRNRYHAPAHDRLHDNLEHGALHRDLDHREAHRQPMTYRQHDRLHEALEHEAYHDRLDHREFHRQVAPRPYQGYGNGYRYDNRGFGFGYGPGGLSIWYRR